MQGNAIHPQKTANILLQRIVVADVVAVQAAATLMQYFTRRLLWFISLGEGDGCHEEPLSLQPTGAAPRRLSVPRSTGQEQGTHQTGCDNSCCIVGYLQIA